MYFPDSYRWSAEMLAIFGTAPYGGAALSEAHRIGRQLRGHVGDDDAWFRAWTEGGDRLRDRAQKAENAGHRITAASTYFVRAENATAERAPCVVRFGGFDTQKELQYVRGVPDLVRRGMSCLLVDGPGMGEAIRFRCQPITSNGCLARTRSRRRSRNSRSSASTA
jgi:hypothetical protein